MLKLVFCLSVLATVGLAPPPAAAVEAKISGAIRVIDGDTIDVNGIRIRLFGIDAPEGDQTCTSRRGKVALCGDWVSRQVRKTYQGRQASCRRVDTDRYGRTVARCAVSGVDMGQDLVARGLAFAYAKYSQDYVAVEAAAMQRGHGIHAYQLIRPAAFRAEKKAGQVKHVQKTSQTGCTIKGNISAKGVKIYHSEGQRDYKKTRISTNKGERWFCTGAEARAAGWRAAKR